MDYLAKDQPKLTPKEFVVEKVLPGVVALAISGMVIYSGVWWGGRVLSAFDHLWTSEEPAEPAPTVVYAF